MKNKVYEFWYNDSINECAAISISLHRTKRGAEMAMAFHKEQKRKEHEELYKDEKPNMIPFAFDYMCKWGVRLRDIFE